MQYKLWLTVDLCEFHHENENAFNLHKTRTTTRRILHVPGMCYVPGLEDSSPIDTTKGSSILIARVIYRVRRTWKRELIA